MKMKQKLLKANNEESKKGIAPFGNVPALEESSESEGEGDMKME
jgi:hypothetical protein